jgi:hypothetical protein
MSRVPAIATNAASGTMSDAGLLIEVGNRPIQVDNRADVAVITFPHGAILHLNEFGGGCPADCSPQFHLTRSVVVDGRVFTLGFIANAKSDTLFSSRPDGSLVVSVSQQNAVAGDLMVYASGTDGQSHRVMVDSRGHLLIDTKPLSGDTAVDMPTGAGLDIGGMDRLGLFPTPRHETPTEFLFTLCDGTECQLSYRVRSLVAPFSGTVHCLPESRGVELDNGAVRLQFKPVPGYGIQTCTGPHNVLAGSVIADYFVHYLVSAESASGAPLSLVATADGTLYVGQVVATAGCPPCRGQ